MAWLEIYSIYLIAYFQLCDRVALWCVACSVQITKYTRLGFHYVYSIYGVCVCGGFQTPSLLGTKLMPLVPRALLQI